MKTPGDKFAEAFDRSALVTLSDRLARSDTLAPAIAAFDKTVDRIEAGLARTLREREERWTRVGVPIERLKTPTLDSPSWSADAREP